MSSYLIKVKSCETAPNAEVEYWSQQTVSATQKNLYYNLGNVGIGVPNALAKLQVDGSVGIGTGYATTTPPVDGLIVSGAVGFGTATPTSALHVNGTVKATAFEGDGSLITNLNGASVTGANLTGINGTNITTGTVAVERGGTGVSTATGTGSVVLSTIPTITGPILSATTLTSTLQAGKLEYSTGLYGSPNETNRGLLPTEATCVLSAPRVLLTSTAVQSFFPVAYTMASATTYKWRAVINMSRAAGVTSHTIGTSIGGTATFTGVQYTISSTVANGGAPVLEWISTNANTTVTAANIVATENNTFIVDGIARVNVGGTFNLQFTYSAAPGGVPTVAAGSWISFYPIGDNTVTTVGDTWV